MSEFKIAKVLNDMVPGPVATAVIQTIYKSESGINLCYGTGTPPTTAATYAPGCIMMIIDTGKVYVNIETTLASAANWSIIGSVSS